MEKMIGTSMNNLKTNIEKIAELFPNAVKDGKLDFDALRIMLGDDIDSSKEKYQFIWNGKSESIRIAQTPTTATLRPNKEKSKDWDETQNLYIEGDNLEVLKLLQKTYYGRIKLIYIDPPYNTGSDFVYEDDFSNSINSYKEQTSQEKKSNPETSGRFHCNWLNMIYPRLILSRNLLSNDGVIFISIDDHEQANMKKICDEIFGEYNFLAQVVWERAFAPINLKKHFSESHDYILCYAKNKELAVCNGLLRNDESNMRYSNPDNDPRGVWQSDNATVGPAVAEKIYEIITPTGKRIMPPSGRCWLYTKDRFQEMIADNRIWFGEDGNNVPRVKRFLSEVKQGLTPMTIWKYSEVGHSQDATKALKDLFDGKAYFDYPKPVELIQRCVQLYSETDSIILDFFSGSATTAHAVMSMNAEDAGKRKFIMVQLPEVCSEKSEAFKDGYCNICEIGEERIRRAGDRIKAENPLLTQDLDVGFKVFHLDSTNINPWDNANEYDENTIYNSTTVFKLDRSKNDILYEILLKYGLFDQPVSEVKINDKTVYLVGQRHMIVCLEDDLTSNDISEICQLKPRVVVFKEDGFSDDNAKINAEYNLKNAGVEDVKCI